MDQSRRLLLSRFDCDCCSIELRAVNPCGGGRAVIRTFRPISILYRYICRYAGITNAKHFVQLDFDITCNKRRPKYFAIFSPDELEYF